MISFCTLNNIKGGEKEQGHTSKVFEMCLTIAELSNSVYMTLNARARSSQAVQVLDDIQSLISDGGRRLSSKSRRALDATFADLMKAAQAYGRYCYRKTAAGSFTGERVGYTPFKRVTQLLQAAHLLEEVSGFGGGIDKRWATRFRSTEKLLAIARDRGVTPGSWSLHFESLPRPSAIQLPLVLRTASKATGGIRREGSPVPVDLARSPARELATQVNALNAFFAKVLIEPADCHFAFQRIFNQADDPQFNWNKGGRLYSLGASYQQMRQTDRQNLRLNGETTVELDLRASHLTILHALLRCPFDPTKDPYEVPGLPREIVKAWVTMTLGHDRFQRCWSKKIKEKYEAEVAEDLQKRFPIKSVRDKVLKHLPVLDGWPSCPVRWGDLQYLESEVIIGTVHTLAMEYDVPALPVHDSIIVPESSEALARKILSQSFERHFGVKPALCTA